ncbi:MAG TPA: hypothetical protein VN842_03040, partial [Thermoplasmata archaeon]|nr:hypothetical protein [Thermoplasmata archaeon]
MVEPSTLPLELLVLFLSAGALALSGILAGLLIEPAGRRPKPPHPQLRLRPLLRELVLPPVLATLVATLVLAGLVQAASLRIGSSHDVELALAVGAFGGLAVALFAIGVTILIPRAATERPVDLLTDRRPRRGWTASAAISSGAGGAALLTLIGLYVTLDGHVPAMIAAALGAA